MAEKNNLGPNEARIDNQIKKPTGLEHLTGPSKEANKLPEGPNDATNLMWLACQGRSPEPFSAQSCVVHGEHHL
jgi:hypothetical protein